jgi:hypothetical protein
MGGLRQRIGGAFWSRFGRRRGERRGERRSEERERAPVLRTLVGAFVSAVVVLAIAVPLGYGWWAESRDEVARELLERGAFSLERCAEVEGSFSSCTTGRLNEAHPGVNWRVGYGFAGRGEIGLQGLGENAYSIASRSASGRTFTYTYRNGSVERGSSHPVGGEADWEGTAV